MPFDEFAKSVFMLDVEVNKHRFLGTTVQELLHYIDDLNEWASPKEREKAFAEQTVCELYVYPNGRGDLLAVYASTFTAAFEEAVKRVNRTKEKKNDSTSAKNKSE